jgi:hypothetical protein
MPKLQTPSLLDRKAGAADRDNKDKHDRRSVRGRSAVMGPRVIPGSDGAAPYHAEGSPQSRLPSQGRLQRLRQFLTGQHDRIRFHAARFGSLFNQYRDIAFGDAVRPQTDDLKCLA